MKKLILLILVLCCLFSACGTSDENSIITTQAVEKSVTPTSALPTAYIPLIKASAVISESYNNKPLQVMNGCGIFLQNSTLLDFSAYTRYDAYAIDEENQLSALSVNQFNNAYTVDGSRYRFTFDWTNNSGLKVLTSASDETTATMLLHSDYGTQALFFLPEHLDTDSGLVYSNYPVLLDFDTGELVDFLSGCKLDKLTGICNAAFTSDRSGLLLAQDGGALYYCDLTSKTVYSLDELSGEPVKACTTSDNKIICWSSSNTQQLSGTLGDYHFWYIDLDSFTRQEMPELELSSELGPLRFAYISGFSSTRRDNNMYSGSTYALCTGGSGDSYVLDMASWTITPLSGYILPASNIACVGSPDGNYLLLEDLANTKAYVLDYAICSISQLDISSTNHLNWFDSISVIEQPGDGNYYVYNII
jgi:hypothetical protein